jgi:hypothetical protein
VVVTSAVGVLGGPIDSVGGGGNFGVGIGMRHCCGRDYGYYGCWVFNCALLYVQLSGADMFLQSGSSSGRKFCLLYFARNVCHRFPIDAGSSRLREMSATEGNLCLRDALMVLC